MTKGSDADIVTPRRTTQPCADPGTQMMSQQATGPLPACTARRCKAERLAHIGLCSTITTAKRENLHMQAKGLSPTGGC